MLATYLLLYAPFGLSFCITYVCTIFCQMLAHRLNILDVPNTTVKTHKAAIPYFGGVAIAAGFFCSVLVFSDSYRDFLPFLFGLLIFLTVGLIDDVYSLHPLHKMTGQCFASCWFIIESIYLKRIFFTHHLWLIPILLFWIILITNAFNLIDVLDGLASCVALHACIGFFIIIVFSNQMHLAPMLLGLTGALLAFLTYNKPPAAIYMGDAGSLFLGGFFATLPFFITWNTHNQYGFLGAFFLLAIPIIEVGMLVIIRTYNGIPFYRASPHHFCHYLLKQSYSKFSILLITSFFCWIYILIGVGWSLYSVPFLLIISLSMIWFITWIYVVLQPFKIK